MERRPAHMMTMERTFVCWKYFELDISNIYFFSQRSGRYKAGHPSRIIIRGYCLWKRSYLSWHELRRELIFHSERILVTCSHFCAHIVENFENFNVLKHLLYMKTFVSNIYLLVHKNSINLLTNVNYKKSELILCFI